METKEQNSIPSKFLLTILLGLPLLSLVLIGIQASESAIVSAPRFITEVAVFFPGPRGKIDTLHQLGYEQQAYKFAAFIGVYLTMLFLAILVSIPYVIVRNIGISSLAENKQYTRSDKIWTGVAVGSALYFLFLAQELTSNPM